MAYVVVKYKVRNFSDWKARFDIYSETRKDAGERGYQVFYEDHNPNSLVMLLEWDSAMRARIWFHSETFRTFMVQAGILDEPEMMYVGEAASGRL